MLILCLMMPMFLIGCAGNAAPVDNSSTQAEEEAQPLQTSYTLSTPTVSGGIVYGAGTYYENERVYMYAVPNNGYEFLRWDDGNTGNPRLLTMTENLTHYAVFSQKPKYAVIESAFIQFPSGYGGWDVPNIGDKIICKSWSFALGSETYGSSGAEQVMMECKTSGILSSYVFYGCRNTLHISNGEPFVVNNRILLDTDIKNNVSLKVNMSILGEDQGEVTLTLHGDSFMFSSSEYNSQGYKGFKFDYPGYGMIEVCLIYTISY